MKFNKMESALYWPVYLSIACVLSLGLGTLYCMEPGNNLYKRPMPSFIPGLLFLAIGVWLGLRPFSGIYFGDTYNYAMVYEMGIDIDPASLGWRDEWLWIMAMGWCREAGLSAHGFFLIVELAYMGSTLLAAIKLMPKHVGVALAFVLCSAMFYAYGVNGIRSGLSCQIMVLAITYLCKGPRFWVFPLMIVAYSLHHSAALQIASALGACYVLKKPSYAMAVWVAALLLSIVFSGVIAEALPSFDLDSRLQTNDVREIDMEQFSHQGYRWDFVLYSMLPLPLIWEVCVRRKASNRAYEILAATYCLCNAAWLLLIGVPYSNRIGYLSWCMMPFVIAYPLLNLTLWQHQDRAIGLILLGYLVLTLFIT